MPDGTPGRLLERLGPLVALVDTPGLFGIPPRLGAPDRIGPVARLFAPGRF